MANLYASIDNGLAHLRFSQIEAAQSITGELVRKHAINPCLLAAVAYCAGEIAGKRFERQRVKKRQAPPLEWEFIETRKGRELWRECTKGGDMAPYFKAKAVYQLQRDMELGIAPPHRRMDRPAPAESYALLIERDLPRVSDKLSAMAQSLAQLHGTLQIMAAREAAKADFTGSDT